jgi:hypothetical protein
LNSGSHREGRRNQRLVARELIDEHHLVGQREHAGGDECGVRGGEAAIAGERAEPECGAEQHRGRHGEDGEQGAGENTPGEAGCRDRFGPVLTPMIAASCHRFLEPEEPREEWRVAWPKPRPARGSKSRRTLIGQCRTRGQRP